MRRTPCLLLVVVAGALLSGCGGDLTAPDAEATTTLLPQTQVPSTTAIPTTTVPTINGVPLRPQISYDELTDKPTRFNPRATIGIHVGGGDQDHVSTFLEAKPAGTIHAGSDFDGEPYYRIRGYDDQEVEVELTEGGRKLHADDARFASFQAGDAVRGIGIAEGTQVAAATEADLVLSQAATATGRSTITVRWPAIDGTRIRYDVNGVIRLTNQGDPERNGTFEIFAGNRGIEGIYCVRAQWWNGVWSDSSRSTAIDGGTIFSVGSGEHGDELWMTGDGMASDSDPVAIQSSNVKVDPDVLATSDARSAAGALDDLDAAVVASSDRSVANTRLAAGVAVGLAIALAVVVDRRGRRRYADLERQLLALGVVPDVVAGEVVDHAGEVVAPIGSDRGPHGDAQDDADHHE